MATTPSNSYPSFLGTGWSFPPTFTPGNASVVMTSNDDDIDASLKILLSTSLGERFLNPKYGLDLHRLVFEPMSTTMLSDLKDQVKVAILIYEPRIELISVDLDVSTQAQGMVSIVVSYQTKVTNSRYNLVFPFYITDGAEVTPSL